MAVLNGLSGYRSPTAAPVNVRPVTPDPSGGSRIVIDGTPVRVAMLAIAAAVGLAALKWAGFRFNVGV